MAFVKKWVNPTTIDGEELLEYRIWNAMIQRVKYYKGYEEVSCDDRFKDYDYFYEWCQEQVGFKELDENGRVFSLDKDILSDGVGVYGPDTCVFIPQTLNNLFKSTSSELPRGVSLRSDVVGKGKKYVARLTRGGKCVYLGSYHNPQDASLAYEVSRKEYLIELKEIYGARVDDRVWIFLLS